MPESHFRWRTQLFYAFEFDVIIKRKRARDVSSMFCDVFFLFWACVLSCAFAPAAAVVLLSRARTFLLCTHLLENAKPSGRAVAADRKPCHGRASRLSAEIKL